MTRSIFYFILISIAVSATIAGCKKQDESSTNIPNKITVQGNRFVDNYGRHVILNGINVVSKSKKEGYIFKGGPEFYANLAKWGFNSIRFIIIWDRLEPEPGVYNEEYLKEIDQRIQWAADNGVFVILDMHQDLFSVKYSDGAPEWATLDEGKSHQTGVIWSDAYMLSEAVQTAFDNFWANKPASDGIGIQDHYANLWKHIAKRYANNNTVIGYDIMNEPFAGSVGEEAMPALLTAYGELVYSLTGKVMNGEELAQTWGGEASRTEALKLLSTKENYAPVIDALNDINHQFESTQLQAMYQKVSNAIREVDQNHILFLEHSYFGNMGVKSSIERVKLADGTPDPQVAYAPHGYDLVTDTKDAASAESDRMEFIFDRIKEKGRQLNMPVWMGEWGAYYNHSDGIIPVARYAVGLLEKNLFGQAYWSYDPGTENLEYFQKALLRPYPAYTNGELLSYNYNFENAELNIHWKETSQNKKPSLIYIPWFSLINKETYRKSINATFESIPNTGAGWMIVPSEGKDSERKLIISFSKQ